MAYYQIRIHHDDRDLLCEITNWINTHDAPVILAVIEEGTQNERQHAHILATIQINKNTFDRHLKDAYPQIHGNRSKSIKPIRATLDANIQYLCKGTGRDTQPDLILATISHEEIMAYNKSYYDFHAPQPQQTQSQQENEPKISKPRKPAQTWTEKITNEFIANLPFIGKDDLTPEQLDKYYVDMVKGDIHYEVEGHEYERKIYLTPKGAPFEKNKDTMDFITSYVMKKLGRKRKVMDQYIAARIVLGVFNAVTDGEDPELHAAIMKQLGF